MAFSDLRHPRRGDERAGHQQHRRPRRRDRAPRATRAERHQASRARAHPHRAARRHPAPRQHGRRLDRALRVARARRPRLHATLQGERTIHGLPWPFPAFHRPPWPSMASPDLPWPSVASRGLPWLSTDRHARSASRYLARPSAATSSSGRRVGLAVGRMRTIQTAKPPPPSPRTRTDAASLGFPATTHRPALLAPCMHL